MVARFYDYLVAFLVFLSSFIQIKDFEAFPSMIPKAGPKHSYSCILYLSIWDLLIRVIFDFFIFFLRRLVKLYGSHWLYESYWLYGGY